MQYSLKIFKPVQTQRNVNIFRQNDHHKATNRNHSQQSRKHLGLYKGKKCQWTQKSLAQFTTSHSQLPSPEEQIKKIIQWRFQRSKIKKYIYCNHSGRSLGSLRQFSPDSEEYKQLANMKVVNIYDYHGRQPRFKTFRRTHNFKLKIVQSNIRPQIACLTSISPSNAVVVDNNLSGRINPAYIPTVWKRKNKKTKKQTPSKQKLLAKSMDTKEVMSNLRINEKRAESQADRSESLHSYTKMHFSKVRVFRQK